MTLTLNEKDGDMKNECAECGHEYRWHFEHDKLPSGRTGCGHPNCECASYRFNTIPKGEYDLPNPFDRSDSDDEPEAKAIEPSPQLCECGHAAMNHHSYSAGHKAEGSCLHKGCYCHSLKLATRSQPSTPTGGGITFYDKKNNVMNPNQVAQALNSSSRVRELMEAVDAVIEAGDALHDAMIYASRANGIVKGRAELLTAEDNWIQKRAALEAVKGIVS